MAEIKIIHVAVGVIINHKGEILFAQRPSDKTYTGWWELPGGKIEINEPVAEALRRELAEELGIQVTMCRPWLIHQHHYPHATVRLNFYIVEEWTGLPSGQEGQHLAWVSFKKANQVLPKSAPHADAQVSLQHALTTQAAIGLEPTPPTHPFLPASLPILRWLQLPTRYALTQINHPNAVAQFLEKLSYQLIQGLKLVQFREPEWQAQGNLDALYQTFLDVRMLCAKHGALLLVNSTHPQPWWEQADGVHLRSADMHLARTLKAHPHRWVGASAHNNAEVQQAKEWGIDFLTISPVKPTLSHTEQAGLGWNHFSLLASKAGIPVFAMGGLNTDDIQYAQQHGAHGIAGIRGFWGNEQ